MADYKDQQATDPAKAGEPSSSSNESEALRQEGMDGAYGSSCCTPGKKAFHPWESDTWECETDETCDTSDATSASSLNSESLETTQPEPMDRTFAARPDAAQNTALWQDLVNSQQPTDGARDDGAKLGETVGTPAMQWTLVDLGTASCDTPGCDPATCDAEDCQEDGRATSYKEMPDYATAGVTSEPGPAPEPMFGRSEPESAPQTNAEPAAEPKKRGRGKKAATDSAVFPEQAAAPAAKPKRGAAKKGAKKPAAKKTAKKGARKPPTKAKKGAAKKGAKKPATPRGKKAAATPGTNGQAATDAPMPTEKAA